MVKKICEYCGKPFYNRGHNAQKMHKACAELKRKEDNAKRLRIKRREFKLWLESCELDRVHNQSVPEMGFTQNDYDMNNKFVGGNTKFLATPTFGCTKDGKRKDNKFSNLPKEREKQIKDILNKIKKEKSFIFNSSQQHNTHFLSNYYNRNDSDSLGYDGYY